MKFPTEHEELRDQLRRQLTQTIMREAVVTYAHAARVLNVSRSRARQLAQSGDLRTTKQDGRTYVTKASLDQLVANRSRRP